MIIDTDTFTPIASLAGGMLIDLAATLLVIFSGRIAGMCSLYCWPYFCADGLFFILAFAGY